MLSGKYPALIFSLFILLVPVTAPAKQSQKRHHKVISARIFNRPIQGQEALIREIRAAIVASGGDASIGIQIKSMKYNDILYSSRSNQLLTPASTLKILTAEAALIYLGPNYHFQTRVMTDAKNLSDGTLNGSLWLVHSGDPTFTYYDMTDLMVALKSQQIRAIRDNIHIDNTAYDQDNIGPGWLWKDHQYCYAAPVNASIINHNCVSFSITPARKEKFPAVVVESPRYFYAAIRNAVITRPTRARSCHVTVTSDATNTISLNGCLPRGHYSRSASVVISDILHYNLSLIKHLLRTSRIQIGGQITPAPAPAGLRVIATHESHPLHELIHDMLKKSDNVIAGSLFKKLGQLHSGQPGSWKNGSDAVANILSSKASVDTRQMNVLDGSGLSPDNEISAQQMIQVLEFAFHHDRTSYEFISALPVAGVDGTLKNRLRNIAGRIRAKTGTMSDAGVSSLAGYAVTRDHEPLAFAILVNGHKGNVWKYRLMEDKIATALANFSRGES